MAGSDSHYVHGTSEEEQARLSRLNHLLNAATLRELDLRGGERVLDVGAGLGQLTRAMARAVGPAGHVLGVERSREQIDRGIALAKEAGEEHLVEMRMGDARRLPLEESEEGSFDLAHARFLLEHVPDPEVVVREMVRAVKPGGRIVLADDDHALLRLCPEPAGLRTVWEGYCRAYDQAGNDPYVGRRLPALLEEAGASPRRATLVPFGTCAGDPDFPAFVENLAFILEEAAEAVALTGLVTVEEVREAARQVRAVTRRKGAVIWYAMPLALGTRR